MKTSNRLQQMNACPDAIKWVGKRGPMTAWRDCNRADWMLWIAGRLNIDKKLIVLAACDCAETALKYLPDGEDRPAKAIQTSRNWCNGTATIQECRDAAYAAYAAYAATATATAADAAAYAAYAAYAATATAATAATYAAYAATATAATATAYDAAAAAYAADAARAKAHKTNADLVRKRIPYKLIAVRWNN